MDKAERTAMDERAVEAAAEAIRAARIDPLPSLWEGPGYALELARAVVAAYEAAKPVADDDKPYCWIMRPGNGHEIVLHDDQEMLRFRSMDDREIFPLYKHAAKPAPMSTSGEMVERVARALAAHAGGKITGPSRHAAADEFGWDAGGRYREQYVEAHWQRHMPAAWFAYGVMASRLASLEALFAEQAGELERVKASFKETYAELNQTRDILAATIPECVRHLVDCVKAERRALAAEAALAKAGDGGSHG